MFIQLYIPCRLMTLAYVITDLVGRNLSREFHCNVSTVPETLPIHFENPDFWPRFGCICFWSVIIVFAYSSAAPLMKDVGFYWTI